MSGFIAWLQGKKTYILVILGVAALLVQWVSGDISFLQFVQSDQFVELLALLGIGALRAGVTKSGPNGG